MSKKKTDSMIGHDPLAWIHDTTPRKELQAEAASMDGAEVEAKQHPALEDMMVDVLDVDGMVKGGVEPTVVHLEGDLTIQYIHELYAKLMLALEDSSGAIALDAASVGRVDTSAVQLLCAFAKQAESGGRTFSWLSSAACLFEVAQSLGMVDRLKLTPKTCVS